MAKPPSVPRKRAYPVTKPDLDNCFKLLTDALERFLYSNDAQIVDVHMRKSYGESPCIRVTIEELASFAADCAAIIRKRPAPQEAQL
jgi:Holliday junction resolvase RusA-like endonuclease